MSKIVPPQDPSAVPTGNDQLVFDVLRTADCALSAYDIMDLLKQDRPRIAPTTVYRALEHLIRAGRVQRIDPLNAYLPATATDDRALVFAICDDCGRVQERDAGADVRRITKALAKDSFRPTHPVVEAHGRCGACDATGGKA